MNFIGRSSVFCTYCCTYDKRDELLIICKLFVIYHWVELQADYSPRKIYGYVSENTVTINSFATSIYAHSNCSTMFKDLTNIENIQTTQTELFNTEDVTDMSYMFAGCTNLNILQGISFNTTNVTTMAHMFEGCSAMGQLDLSAFNTHHLRGDGMVAMFKNCYGLQTLTLNLFTTEQITDMSELFRGCSNMTELNINRFVISNNTTLTNMCKDLNSAHTEWNKCAISCTDTVRSTLLSQDANNNYITGIDPTKVSFPLQEGSAK